ncbi:lysophospholipid acyltransferase family protein [Altererythrobacter sp. Root672]|uniref:lysophospholipid acyltransferase family protein n=1 Tax=Altererythrobacter sp. Root672 TaxID=1736584 RepID=UPI0006FF7DD6|nr:lysophospholipid acyltransferase family protein [Altererythrobacter sp. Root672]KRA80618.1 glycerol acyltransferase [Altererythrobacter sp. Root672]
MNVVRSLLFYLAFYAGSFFYVGMSALVAMVAPSRVRPFPDAWSRYHRACTRVLLGIKVVEIGHRPDGPALFAIKHESFFEAIDLPNLLDYPVPFGKQELFEIPGWGRAARAYGSVEVRRDQGAKALRAMMTDARKFIASGRPLVIFPEGTRVPHGTRPPLQAGFAGIYKLIGLPVVPVAVNSGPLYHRLWKRSGTITLQFGEVIEPGLPREEIEVRVHAAINALNS